MTDMTPIRSAAGQFLPGRSGNPAGRPKGSRNRATLLAALIDEADHDAIVRAVVDRALAGEWAAQRACFTRLVAPLREAPVTLDLPPVASPVDVAEAGAALIAAAAAGEITLAEAQRVMSLLTAQLKILEATAAAEPGRDAPARDATGAGATHQPPARAQVEADRSPSRARPGPALSAVEGGGACISPLIEEAADRGAAGHSAGSAAQPGHIVPADAPSPAVPRHDPLPKFGRPAQRSTALRQARTIALTGTSACISPVSAGADARLRAPAFALPAFGDRASPASLALRQGASAAGFGAKAARAA